MSADRITRRNLLKLSAYAAFGSVLAACGATPTAAPATQAPVAEATVAEAAPTEVAPEATAAPAAAEQAKVGFMMWAWSPENEQFERDRVDGFNKSQSGVVVDPIIMPYGDLWTKLDVLVASGQAPDTVWYDYAAYPLIAKGEFIDLNPFVETVPDFLDDSKYDQGFWKPAQMLGDDQKLSLPIGGEGMNVFYNSSLYDADGVAYPGDSLTWDDYLPMAQSLTKSEGDTITQYGTSLATMMAWWAWPAIVWANGGTLVDSHYQPSKCTLDTPEAIEALQYLQDLVFKHKVAPDPAAAATLGEQGGDFASGKVAMFIDGAWDVVGFRGIDRFTWDIGLLPEGPKGRISPFWIGGPMIAKQSKNRDAAWAWCRWTGEADGEAMIATSGQQVTWQRSARDLKVDGAVPANYGKRFETLDSLLPADIWSAQWNEVLDKVWNPEFDKFWTNQITAEQLVATITPKTTELLQAG